jgi:hypothetical protein
MLDRGFPLLVGGLADRARAVSDLLTGAPSPLILCAIAAAGMGMLVWRGRSRIAGLTSARTATTVAVLVLAAVAASAYGHEAQSRTAQRGQGPERVPLGQARSSISPGAIGYHTVYPRALSPAAEGLPAVAQQRPFSHEEHEVLSCRECHAAGEEHRAEVPEVWTPLRCATCHHDPRLPYTCGDCHGPRDLPPPGPVPQTLALSVWEHPRLRELPFAHETHTGVACEECHRTPVLLQFDRECASCHEDHHQPAAECTQCHLPAEPEAHGLEVHLTCAASGCHSSDTAVRPTHSRTVCLACHTDQVDHEPDGVCATCHMVPDLPEAVIGIGSPLSARSGGQP